MPFFSISGSEFVEMFVGVGAARVRDLFEQAPPKAPCDHLHRRARRPGPGPRHRRDGRARREGADPEPAPRELDGFDPATGIVLLAATNRPEILDPALLRAGRFDRQVLVDRPDKSGRMQILSVHAKKVLLEQDLTRRWRRSPPGFTGADLANLVNEAALVATRRGGEQVTMNDFTAAIERIVAGLEKGTGCSTRGSARSSPPRDGPRARRAGAARRDPVHKVSIIPRGIGALGYTIQRPTEDRYLMTRDELEDKMAVLLGGRAAEEIVFGQLSTGAADDLVKVANIARSMVTRYGMVESLGQLAYENRACFGEGLFPETATTASRPRTRSTWRYAPS